MIYFDKFTILFALEIILIIGFILFNLIALLSLLRKKNYLRRIIRRRFKFLKVVLINLAFILLAGFIFYKGYIDLPPNIERSVPSNDGVWQNYSQPIEVEFTVPVLTANLKPSINPKIKGHWVWDKFITSRLTKRGRFIPEETLMPNTRIVIYITQIGRIGFDEAHEFGFVLQSVDLPEVSWISPENNSDNVNIDSKINIYLNKEDENIETWAFQLKPNVELEYKRTNNRLITLIPKESLQKNQDYTLVVKRKPKTIAISDQKTLTEANYELIHVLNFSTVKDRLIKNVIPKGNEVHRDSKILVYFNTDVDKNLAESLFSITPKIEGKITWSGNNVMTFAPKELLKFDTAYKIIFNKGLKDLNGLAVQSIDTSYDFKTIGYISVSQNSPSEGDTNISIHQPIQIEFNQEVDRQSAQANFEIIPGTNGNFSWEGNTMTFTPDSLQYSTHYTINLKKGVKSIYGGDSVGDFAFSFTTRSNVFVISMPWYAQPQNPPSFSCNIFAARMALAWKGYYTSTTQLIGEIGYDTSFNGEWQGNPNSVYVGNADGSWGYGVYWYPVQRLFTNRGIKTDVHEGWNIYELARSIEEGHPVVIWRYNGESRDYDRNWIANDGSYVHGINGQHGGVVTGFIGSSDNPISFYINDPWYGLIWMDAYTFDYYWSRLNRVGLVVY